MVFFLLAACALTAEKPASSAADPGLDSAADTASDTAIDTACTPESWWSDLDGDGYGDAANVIEACTAPAGYVENVGDCDDSTRTISPDALESCDGVDQDCDGDIDEQAVDAAIWYPDRDQDGLGNESEAVTACAQPDGYIAVAGDCDDYDRSTGGATPWYADSDGDGWGDAEVLACAQPVGSVATAGDCDDADSASFPGAAEVCDGLDQDCDHVLDNDAVDMLAWYPDKDADGYGAGEASVACDAPAEHVENGDDCDDTSAVVNPAAVETCSGLDEDCDGLVDADDPDMSGLATWYLDADGDDHGDVVQVLSSCDRPAGYALDPDDCDDTDASVFPGADETCDGTDEDCDFAVDDNAIDAVDWFADADADSFGDPADLAVGCEALLGRVDNALDCDDTESGVFPGAAEACDSVDNDCDGTIDEGQWYADVDGDGYGNAAVPDTSCAAPAGYLADSSDCDDADGSISPAGNEVCDAADLDEDCDGLADDDDVATGGTGWYADADGDGFGAGLPVAACDAPAGYSADASDCDDADDAISPAGSEVCGGADENCDGLVDDDDPSVTGTTPWYLDSDADGYGGTAYVDSCLVPAGYAATPDDCDDSEPAISPGAYEICADAVDQDCDGADVTVCDADGDGYDVSTDCDDTNPDINPGEREACDAANVDEDCDGVADDADGSAYTVSKVRYYEDVDGDGYGDPGGTLQCDIDPGYVENDEDCDDADAAISPDAADLCASGIDEDCSGEVDDCTRYAVEGAALTMTGDASLYFGNAAVGGDFGGTGGSSIVVSALYGLPAEHLFVFDATQRGEIADDAAVAEFSGTALGGYYAYEMRAADTDGDGLSDLLVSSSWDAILVYGGDVLAGGDIATAYAAQPWTGQNEFMEADGDGLADVVGIDVIGADTMVGIAYGPVFGTYSSTTTNCLVEVTGSSGSWTLGSADLDGDGMDSLAVGNSGDRNVLLFHDACASSSSADADAEIAGPTNGATSIAAGLGSADTNDDGYTDLVITANGADDDSAWLVPNPAGSGPVDTLATAVFVGDGSTGRTFSTVASGDYDGSAGDEVGFVWQNTYEQCGRAYILEAWTGRVEMGDLVYAGYGATIEGDWPNCLGDTMSNAGDTDGDGTDDLLLTNYEGYGGTPAAWLWLGSELLP